MTECFTDTTLNAFLLTRQWREIASPQKEHTNAKRLQLIYWLKSEEGPLQLIIENQPAVFFIEKQDVVKARRILDEVLSGADHGWYCRDLPLKSFSHLPVCAFYFNRQRSLYFARDELVKHGISLFESDIRPTDRFLMERFVRAGVKISGRVNRREGFLQAKNAKLTPIRYRAPMTVLSLDIETAMSGDRLYSIAAYVDYYNAQQGESAPEKLASSQVFMLGDAQACSPENLGFFRSERALMQAFLRWFDEFDPDILIGWNVVNFDLRFLQRKADSLGMPLLLGRDRQRINWRRSRDDDQYYRLTVPGRAVLDGIETLKSATYVFESFSLNYVANALLQRSKLVHDVDNRGEEITRLFQEDKISLAAYNLEDCRLVWEIFQHTQLIDFALERADMTGLSLDRFGGSVAAFDNRYLPLLHRRGYVAPAMPADPESVGSPGGYVMDSLPGLYRNVLVLDFKSLYPSIIRTFSVDPLALAVGAREHGGNDKPSGARIPGFNGAVFDSESALLPELISELWQLREKAKQAENAAMSQAVKILMNSFYGVLGTPGCRFFDARLPSSITLRGHEILQKTKDLVQLQGYEVIYGDTDSLFVWLKNIDEETPTADLYKLGDTLTEYLNTWWQSWLRTEFNLQNHLELEFETCFSVFVMPTIRGAETGTKKRYAGKKIYRDQNVEADIVFKGLEAVRTDWTALAREFQIELYRRVFNNEPVDAFIRETIADMYAGESDDKLVYRKRIRRRLDEYTRNVPPHVQAARIAEDKLRQQGKPSRYARGGWIRYQLTLTGPEPLEFVTGALDYDAYLERQLIPIIDSIMQFLNTSYESIAGRQLGLF